MPGGGIFTVQNKRRPGAYINFKSVAKPSSLVGDRGVMTAALPMTWGPEGALITLFGSDLLDGSSLAKVGCTAFDVEEGLPFRLALSNCYKALLFRADTGGAAAAATLAGADTTAIIATAKYKGTTGNKLSIKTTADSPEAGSTKVDILFNGEVKESFTVTTATPAGLEDIVSDWVVFTVGAAAIAVPAIAATPLVGGTNGTVNEASYADYFDLVTTQNWQCMAIQSDTGTAPALIAAKIKSMRDELGKKVQGVVYNSVAADYEGIISVKQGFKTAQETVSVSLFPLWVASLTAGSAVNRSNTAMVVPDATEIVGYVAENEIEANLELGWFLLSYRQDGAVCVEQDINCLHTFTADKGYAFSKNRVVRCLDDIGNNVALIFNRNYAGKMDNTNLGRNVFKSEIISLVDQRQAIGAVQNFDAPSDVIIQQGLSIDSVVVDLAIQPVDSMEKLYMTVTVDA